MFLPFGILYPLSQKEPTGKKCVIGGLVAKLMVDSFELDYSGGKTSYSFGNIDFMSNNGVTVAVVNMSSAKSVAKKAGASA